jgi:DNA topoisomerase-2
VAQLAGYVAEKTNYHHGEQCLFDTIIKMSQDFVGSNNIPILSKQGMAGTRMSLGKDAASARYVFVKMGEKTRILFPKEDDHILPENMDEGLEIEPKHYLPIIPTILVNGSEGIGTGWSCSIPSYNPRDLVNWIFCWLDDKPTPSLIPWYNGFTGTISQNSTNKFTTTGIMERVKTKVVVTEIPIGMSIDKFKEFCEELLIDKKIKEYRNLSNPDKILFELTEIKDGPSFTLETLHLTSVITTTNLVVLDENQAIRKFDSIDELFHEFCKHRLLGYIQRKKYQLGICQSEHDLVYNKLRFLKDVMSDKIVLYKTPMEKLETILLESKYSKRENSYNYLLDMPVKNFTKQKLSELMDKIDELKRQIEYWTTIGERELWKSDLNKL